MTDLLPQFNHQLLIRETTGLRQQQVPITIGIPLAQGLFHYGPQIKLLIDGRTEWPCEKRAVSLWADKSIKWIQLTGFIDLEPNQTIDLKIHKRTALEAGRVHRIKPQIGEHKQVLIVATKNYRFHFNQNKFNFFYRIETRDGVLVSSHGNCTLEISGQILANPMIQSLRYHSRTVGDQIRSIALKCKGAFGDHKKKTAVFSCAMEFDLESDRIRCNFTIHNPRAAQHAGGVWDLGDPNSLNFKSLKIGLRVDEAENVRWKADSNADWRVSGTNRISIFQGASGGENWNSPNHVDATNQTNLKISGYQCKEGTKTVLEGGRASPTVQIRLPSTTIKMAIEKFWQNFPKSIDVAENQLEIGLFPDIDDYFHELQPGEKKTHSFTIDLGQPPDSLSFIHQGPEIEINPQWVAHCKALPFFGLLPTSPMQQIIKQGLDPEKGFFAKREAIDEYGWRNFGDLYADHETEGWDPRQGLFISHYNNQYDPIFGFLKQYLATGNYQWFTLADDLAKHVVDIDIYHTRQDKDEYNGGLFWHTDHYQEAKTSSHRSYSKLQKKNVYMDHVGGGGPGGQHCYTNGLLLHYYLTGNQASKEAVLQLSGWISRVYEGSGRLLSLLVDLKNRSRIDLKNITTGRYPLDRGTGNYLQALLDEYDLTQERSTLNRVAHIIANTVHPDDDLEQRDLKNVEMRWYYTAFLQALTRYLWVKEDMGELDESFEYARSAFLLYADWMADHERPYLDNPEKLEFPNNTWTAQDLRKVNLLILAEYYSSRKNSAYREKAIQIQNDIIKRLQADPNSHYTRILALLMQNCGVFEYIESLDQEPDFPTTDANYPPLKTNSSLQAVINVSSALMEALTNFSPKAEIDWLARRSALVSRILGRQS